MFQDKEKVIDTHINTYIYIYMYMRVCARTCVCLRVCVCVLCVCARTCDCLQHLHKRVQKSVQKSRLAICTLFGNTFV